MGYKRRFGKTSKVPIPDKARNEVELVFMHKIVQKLKSTIFLIHLSWMLIKPLANTFQLLVTHLLKKIPKVYQYLVLQTNAPSLQPLLKRSIANSFQCSWFMVGKPHNHYQKYNFQLFSAQMIIQCHYSNTEELIKLLKEIVVPFVEKIRAKLDDPNQSALLIWDVFCGRKNWICNRSFKGK